MDDFFKNLFGQFGKTPEEIETQMQDQLRELMNQMLGPPDSPARKMLEGALGMGKDQATTKAKKIYEDALAKKDEVIDGLLERLHKVGVTPEDVAGTSTDDIPVADDEGIPSSVYVETILTDLQNTEDVVISLLIEKGVFTLAEFEQKLQD